MTGSTQDTEKPPPIGSLNEDNSPPEQVVVPNKTAQTGNDITIGSDVFGGDQSISEIRPIEPVETGAREKTRSNIAFILIWTLSGTIAFSLVAPFLLSYFQNLDKQVFSDVLRTVFPPLVALVGSVTGFYYGSQSR